jgi:dihydroxyacetone kinase DhaKLM complex PTS-EIIA-like component DhaM
LFCLVRFSSAAALIFFDLGAAELEVAATQTLEFADEVFCAAEVPALQGVLSAGSTQSASSALLLRSGLSQTEQSGKSAPLGTKTGQPKLLQRAAK